MTTAQAEPTTTTDAVVSRAPASPPKPGRLRVAILGGGPAGCTLAALLADAGHRVALFDRGQRPKLIVGESLIPAMVPIFRRLGIEERVKQIALVKPGVSFLWSDLEPLHLSFEAVGDRLPQYAYNVPRPQFDLLLLDRALESDVEYVEVHAGVERIDNTDRVKLSEEAVAAAACLEGRQPDLVVDATGRRRTIARLMGLPTNEGDRKDIAHFAHFEGFSTEGLPPGQVRTGYLERGWGWIIPLPGKQSVGAIVPAEEAKSLGSTPVERLEAIIARDPHLSVAGKDAKRITDVVTYNNYQLTADRGHGANWLLLGDAFGFVDPMLSPGMFMAMHSAEIAAEQINRAAPRAASSEQGTAHPAMQKALARYDKDVLYWHHCWRQFIAYFYDGRIFALREAGVEWNTTYRNRFSDMVNGHVESRIACMAAGASTRSYYGWGLIKMTEKLFMRGKTPEAYRVR